MDIRIYQINTDRDENHVVFLDHAFLQKLQGSQEINSKLYDLVFEGAVDCDTLEGVYRMFNLEHPEGYRSRSLSVSDVVEIISGGKRKSGFYFCNSVGFCKVDFMPDECQVSPYFLQTDLQAAHSDASVRAANNKPDRDNTNR